MRINEKDEQIEKCEDFNFDDFFYETPLRKIET